MCSTGSSTLKKRLASLGAKFASDIKETVVGGEQIPPPNAPSTLRVSLQKLGKVRRGAAHARGYGAHARGRELARRNGQGGKP